MLVSTLHLSCNAAPLETKGTGRRGQNRGKNPMFRAYFILTSGQEGVTKPFSVLEQKRNGNKHLIFGYNLEKVWHTNTEKAELKCSG